MKLPETYGNNSTKRIVKFYSTQFSRRYGFQPRILYPQIAGLFSPLLESLSEYQIAMMILVHFDWKGANNDDEFAKKTLEGACFPLEWLPRGSNKYEAFIRNYLKIDFDNQDKVAEEVNKFL